MSDHPEPSLFVIFGGTGDLSRRKLLPALARNEADDQTLFVHGDEVEESWRVYKPLIDDPPKPFDYVAGTWGPKEADHFAIPEADVWQRKNV